MVKRSPFWLTTLIILISLPLILPFLYVILRTANVGWIRSLELLLRPRMWELLSHTLILMVGVTFFSVVIGIGCAFLLERYQFCGKRFFQISMSLPLCIPAFVSCFTWISLTFRMEGMFGAILIMTLSSLPLAYLPVTATLKRLDRSLEEVSLSLGKNRIYTFWHAIFPQLKPAIGSSILLIALHMLIEFGAVAILNYQTFTTAIFQEYEMSFDNNTAALLSAVLLSICLLLLIAESQFRGKTALSFQGKGVNRPYPVKPLTIYGQIGAVLFFSTLFLLSIGIPVIMLLYWLSVGSSAQEGWDWLSFADALSHSILFSALGAILAVLCAFPLVWAAIRYPSRLTRIIERLPYILHAVPGLVIALALIYFGINYARPIYQTFILVLLAYLMLYLPMAQTTLRANLEQLPIAMENVGKTLGRNSFYIFRTIIVPAMLPGIAAAFSLVFLNLMKELTATLLLTPNDIKTLSTAVWEYTSDAKYAAATPYAIMLILFSGIPVFLLKKYAFK